MPNASQDSFSPVEERHIDYILEEEFCVNPEFLTFFIEQARKTVSVLSCVPECASEHSCKAIRSVTTSDGESDVLVTYNSTSPLPIAILIEDKIRAGFQPTQPGRYRERGDAGKGREWSSYWTCLVAHRKYAASPGEFDAIVTLQDIQKYEYSGLQKKDEDMTQFRGLYAEAFEAALPSNRWWHQPAREAWWGDTWFDCRDIRWRKDVLIRHQAEPGYIQLIFPFRDKVLLDAVLAKHVPQEAANSGPLVDVVPIGKTKLALQVKVTPILKFVADGVPFEEFFAAIEYLADLYERSSDILPAEYRVIRTAVESDSDDRILRALRTMLLAHMRGTVSLLGTSMPFPVPDIHKLAAETPAEERYFASLNLMGGFHLELRHESEGQPYIHATHSSRQWGGDSLHYKVTASEVIRLDSENPY